MSVPLLLAHGDDGFGLDQVVAGFANAIGADDRVEIMPERSPDEAAIDRARLESGSVGLFGMRLAVLRQPLRAAGRSTAATERLLALVQELPDGAAPGAGRRPLHARCHTNAAAAGQAGGGGRRRAAARWSSARRRGVASCRPGSAAMPLRWRRPSSRGRPPCWPSGSVGRWPSRTWSGASRRASPTASCGSWPPTRGDRPIAVEDVEALVADTRPASLFAITNAIDRRDAGSRRRGGRSGAGRGPAGAAHPGRPAGAALGPDRGPRPGRARRHAAPKSRSGSGAATPGRRSGWWRRRAATRAWSWRRC